MKEDDIKHFWNLHPCGDSYAGGPAKYRGDYEKFFSKYDSFRYRKEAHILRCLDKIDFNNKHVLEIGLGQGADAEQIIKRGALWSGIDLTPESVERVKARFALRHVPYQALKEGSVLGIPFEAKTFDIVFSHGVLHHVPEIRSAQREIHRVLKRDGELIVMLYAKWSLNYVVSISVLRRLGLLVLYLANLNSKEIYNRHLENVRTVGLFRYLRMKNFIHKNTDGPLNPYSKVYDLSAVAEDFPNFKVIRSYKQFMHAPPLPVGWLPLQRILGWHMWVHLKPKNS